MNMTSSPASSYSSMDISDYFEDSRAAGADTSLDSTTTYQPEPSPTRPIHGPSEGKRADKGKGKKAPKNAQRMSKQLDRAARDAHVRALKTKALSINKAQRPSKAPAPDHQRDVLRMVFDQMTPYPDEAWIAKLALHFNW